MCCETSHFKRFSDRMRLVLLLLTCVIEWCSGVRLSPLENNDKLQDINNLYIAEWQWESWPVKQDPSEHEGKSPSQRKNVVLWKDNSGSAWYLFGGQSVNGDRKKVFSDVWKFTVKTRAWKRLFPAQENIKEANTNKTGGMKPLTNFWNEENAFYFHPDLRNLVLCSGFKNPNPSKVKKLKMWNSLRRKMEMEEDGIEDKLTSLAVYAPKTSKSNTVWQMDAKNKVWTAYICCCETDISKNKDLASSSPERLEKKNKMSYVNQTAERVLDIEKSSNTTKNECANIDSKINKAEDKMENEQQHLKMNNLKNKKKKINQIRKNSESTHYKKIKINKRGSDRNNELPESKFLPPEISTGKQNNTIHEINGTKFNATHKKKDKSLKMKTITEEKNQNRKSELRVEPKRASKYCPDYSESGTSVSWCDVKNEAIITSDISSPQMALWIFNLSTRHWSEEEIKVSDGVEWPACSNLNSVRYAGNEEEVYIVCSQAESEVSKISQKFQEGGSDSLKIPSKDNFNQKLVFKINYKERVLYDLGSIQLNSYFSSLEGERIWQNESQAVLQVIRNSENETILLLAYLDRVDLWVLSRDQENKESFHLVEKIWRGSASKWFDKYNAALYSLLFISESGNSETILVPNPRKIDANEYWPRERGRFIIRVFRNENLKNRSFENKTREHNLTYELLQSDYKPPGFDNQLNQIYGLKVLIFFGISLGIFTAFGTVLFLKKCVNCPPRIRVRNECQKSPLVIRYSVIPDDLLCPMT